MEIIPIQAFKDNYIWTLVDTKTQTAACIDPGDAKPVLEFLEKMPLTLTHIFLTHHHNDHIGGVMSLKNRIPALQIYGPNDSRLPAIVHPVSEGQQLSFGRFNLQILDTPGHTATHISFFEATQAWLFCGDTLFSAGCGRVFDGTYADLFNSLNKLKKLPEKTQIYCAHEYTESNLRFANHVEPLNPHIKQHLQKIQHQKIRCSLPSTIGLEKLINPFFRTHLSSIENYCESQGFLRENPFAYFKHLRMEKDNFN